MVGDIFAFSSYTACVNRRRKWALLGSNSPAI